MIIRDLKNFLQNLARRRSTRQRRQTFRRNDSRAVFKTYF